MARPWVYETKLYLQENWYNFAILMASMILGALAAHFYNSAEQTYNTYLAGAIMILAIAILPSWKKE